MSSCAKTPAYRPADALAPNPLSRPTCFASWPLSRVGNPRGLRGALAAPRRDALAATRTDRATAHGPRAADPTAIQLPDWLLLACWSFGGLFSSFPTLVVIVRERVRRRREEGFFDLRVEKLEGGEGSSFFRPRRS